jgi:hypothetical protein
MVWAAAGARHTRGGDVAAALVPASVPIAESQGKSFVKLVSIRDRNDMASNTHYTQVIGEVTCLK